MKPYNLQTEGLAHSKLGVRVVEEDDSGSGGLSEAAGRADVLKRYFETSRETSASIS